MAADGLERGVVYPPPDRAHLLLTPGQRARQLLLAFLKPRKEPEHALEALRPATPPAAGGGAELQVVQHGHGREELAALRHMGDAAPHDLGRGEPAEARAFPLDESAANGQESGDGLERRGLPGPVAADERHRLPLADLERDVAHRGEVTVTRLDPFKPEQRGHTPPRDRPR